MQKRKKETKTIIDIHNSVQIKTGNFLGKKGRV